VNLEDVLFIDHGSMKRDHADQANASKGLGGAVTLSDGKFPKRPAGSGLLKLADQALVDRGYEQCKTNLAAYGIEWGEESNQSPTEYSDGWCKKNYDCIYVPLEVRMKMIEDAEKRFGDRLLMNTNVVEIIKIGQEAYHVLYQKNGDFVSVFRIICRRLILATGRFAMYHIKHPFPTVSLRVEFGVRVEADADDPAWDRLPNTDTKLVYIGDYRNREYRTFCQIKNGEVIRTKFNGIETHSGRADVPPTGRSNIGVNVRILDVHETDEFVKHAFSTDPFEVSYELLRSMSQANLSDKYAETCYVAVNHFLRHVPLNRDRVRIYGPTIEGVGSYLDLDENLRVKGENVWVMGDATGIFRGWMPAVVSGYYVAHQPNPAARIVHPLYDTARYLRCTSPRITGKSSPALLEIHIFLDPVDPSPENIAKFQADVAKWNAAHPHLDEKRRMKATVLALDFKDIGFVQVLQSSRYIMENDKQKAMRECNKDSQFFVTNHWTVLREKLEASAYGSHGIPISDREAQAWPSYFEAHLRVQSTEGDLMTPEQLEALRVYSVQMTQDLGRPVPLSYNVLKGADGQAQRYLNVRFRGMGLKSIEAILAQISKYMEGSTLHIVKTILEYVVADTFPAMDIGWID
jgi:hypothetical protein